MRNKRTSKWIIFVFLCAFTGSISAQEKQEEEVKKVIDLFFKGLQRGDTSIVKSTMIQNPLLQTTAINPNGETVFRTTDYEKFLQSLASKNPKDTWEEKLLSYNIQIDGNMANVWTPYEFYFNNDFSHCGVNSFQLISFNGVWKMVYLIDTRRKEGCGQ